jgi:hypothetical protein
VRDALRLAALAAALAALPACGAEGGRDDGASSVVHCLVPGDQCVEATSGFDEASRVQLEDVCFATGGTYAVGRCAPDGMLAGGCVFTVELQGGGLAYGAVRYHADEWTLAEAREACAARAGTWDGESGARAARAGQPSGVVVAYVAPFRPTP